MKIENWSIVNCKLILWGVMICPSCGKETKGIKLNGKLFCTFCGEIVKDPTKILEESYTSTIEPKAAEIKENTNHEPDVIVPEDIKHKPTDDAARLLEAEEKVLQIIAKRPVKNPVKINELSIKKHGRKRADHQDFELIKGEPDPINEPELSAPHDDLISDNSKKVESPKPKVNMGEEPTKTHYTLMDKKDRDKLKERSQKRQDVFNLFLKQTAHAISNKSAPTKSKKRKNKNGRRHLGVWIFAAIMAAVVVLGGLVYYVNTYATNTARITSRIESKPSFVYQKPQDIPAGYKLSYLSKSSDNFIEYFYSFSGNKNRYFKVRIEPTEIKPSELQAKIISTLGVDYSSTTVDGIEFWQTSNHQIFAEKGSVLYILSNSGEYSDELFMSFAQEMLL